MTTDPSADPESGSDLLDWLSRVVAGLGALVEHSPAECDSTRIDVIGLLERLQAATGAAQAAELVRFADSQLEKQRAAGVSGRWLGRGIADQIALTCRVSPTEGSRRLSTARALVRDLPYTMTALAAGRINADTARQAVAETSHLDAENRRTVDRQLEASDLTGYSPPEIGRHARRLAYEADPVAAMQRCRGARRDRRVTLRRAADTMAMLTGVLPAEQGVACWEALRSHADRRTAAGDGRTRGQILADTLVERVTGQAAAPDVPVEVNIVVPVEALLDGDRNDPGELSGYGPLPGALIRQLVATGPAKRWWRRVFTAPAGGPERAVVGADLRRRRFPDHLAGLIGIRDRSCRDPYCSAPIRQIDHICRYADGGETSYPNGRGVCVRGNLVRELPGWQVRLVSYLPHVAETLTPTGHRYLSRAPQPP